MPPCRCGAAPNPRQQSWWQQDLPFPEALRPRTSLSRAVIIVGCCGTHGKKELYFLYPYLFWVPSARCTSRGARTTGGHDYGIYGISFHLRSGVNRRKKSSSDTIMEFSRFPPPPPLLCKCSIAIPPPKV